MLWVGKSSPSPVEEAPAKTPIPLLGGEGGVGNVSEEVRGEAALFRHTGALDYPTRPFAHTFIPSRVSPCGKPR